VKRALFVLLALLALVTFTLPARAQDARAAELKKKADQLFDDKRYEEAVAAYDEAYAAHANAAVLFNRGRALQFLARYPAALDSIQRFSREAPPDVRARVPGLAALLADLEAHVSTLTIHCEVTGARVLLGGKQIGECPMAAPIQVNAGPQTLEAFAEGYVPFRREIPLAGGAKENVDIVLVQRDAVAILSVTSSVSSTRISVDGTAIGVAPAEAKLPPGEHQVAVDREGYDQASTRVVLRAGERKEISLDPIPKKSGSVLGAWWFWTGVGVVVAAGVTATVIAVSTEKSAPSGNFSPGTVRF
jgi:hypothetical protein